GGMPANLEPRHVLLAARDGDRPGLLRPFAAGEVPGWEALQAGRLDQARFLLGTAPRGAGLLHGDPDRARGVEGLPRPTGPGPGPRPGPGRGRPGLDPGRPGARGDGLAAARPGPGPPGPAGDGPAARGAAGRPGAARRRLGPRPPRLSATGRAAGGPALGG